jgi:hypothetical protein
MTFLFPNFDTLRFALAGGAVPAEVGLTPARAGVDADGRPWVAPEVTPPASVLGSLRRFGVRVEAKEPAGGVAVAHWPQVFPLRRDPAVPTLTDQTPVLFELHPEQLAGLVAEMLRLGNDRQGYRWLRAAGSESILLRVVGPPYYSLLRALDFRGESPGAIRAYVERVPRVWVQLGFSHPLTDLLQAPDGQLVLLRPPADWVYIDEAPFTDVYEVAEFALPGNRTDWADAPPAGKLTVPLRLAASATTDAAELWVLRGDGLAQIDALVRDADDKLLARLAFAIGDVGGRKTAVLRARPVRATAGQAAPDAAPALALDALAFRTYLRLPNLFLPVGMRLRPPLRRDAVRELLADDPARITWLVPEQDGSFVSQSLPDEAFRPLTDWVDYIVATESERLAAWVQAARFDFGSFMGKEEPLPAKTAPPRGRRKDVSPRGERSEASAAPEEKALASLRSPRGEMGATSTSSTLPGSEASESRPATPSELQVRLRQAEQRFLDAEGPLDAPQRQALWPELARLNTELEQTTDAAACWLNALWDPRGAPAALAAWAWDWVRSEKALPHADLSVADLDRLMANPRPTAPDIRPLAAAVIWAAAQNPVPAALRQRLSAVQRYLEQHDRVLPVRAAWLAWVGLTRLAGTDVLSLARTRDRLLERLLGEGLSAERDLPGFLRFAGQREADRLRIVREKAERLRQLAQEWFPTTVKDVGAYDQTPVYIDLMFAFGLARLGEATAGRALLDRASATLEAAGGETHSILLQAFRYRIDEVFAGRPHAGALPAALIEYVDHLRAEYDEKRRGGGPSGPDDYLAYIVDRLREESRILEPQERLRAYRHRDRFLDEAAAKDLAGWPDVTDPRQLRGRIDRLLGPAAKPLTGSNRVKVLTLAIALAHRVGEAYCLGLVRAAPAAIEAVTSQGDPDPYTLIEAATLLERAIFFAAHYDDRTFVHPALDRLTKLMEAATGPAESPAMASLVGQSLSSLRKFGMRDEAERLLARVERSVFRGRPLDRLRTDDPRTWPQVLEMLLRLAAGWLDFDRPDLAKPVLDEAREYLLRGTADADVPKYVSVACAYISALGHGPVEDALGRAEELLSLGEKGKLKNTFTSSTHYSRFHLNIVEAIVLALANEEFALGPAARRWLGDDEYLVRRRIHADVRAALNQAGM